VARRRPFRDAFIHRRCLVPASGFYEWRREESRKTPWWIRSASGEALAFAALWDRWRPSEGPSIVSFTILTRSAVGGLREIHDRMPVVLWPGDRDRWLDLEPDDPSLKSILEGAAPALVGHPVSDHVNKPAHDDPACVRAEGPERTLVASSADRDGAARDSESE
jgi:putative SOS response-associated peptidase YedK